MRPDYRARYQELYQRHWWWRAREKFILEVIRQYQPPQGWSRILDVGCGNGLFFDQLRQFGEVEGVESDATLVAADGPNRTRIHIGRFEHGLKIRDDFSLILMLDVLEHLEDPAAALRYAFQLLAPGGMLVLTVPAFRVLWTKHDVLNQHVTRFTKRSFRELARGIGFKIEQERYFFHWLFAAKLAQSVLESLHAGSPQPPSVPPTPFNRMFYSLSRFEQKMLGSRSLPFGSSLMVVGRKHSW